MYLVDTSVWIDFLRGKNNSTTELFESLLEEGEVSLCEIVFAEICFGAKDKAQFKKFQKNFAILPMATLPHNWHIKVAQMGFELRKKGFKPFSADILIALASLTNKLPLLTIDKDFFPYQELFGLELVKTN